MSLQNPRRSGGDFFGPALAGTCLAVVISVPLAAFAAAAFGVDYDTRVLIYGGFLAWVCAGGVSLFMKTRRAENQRMTPGRILLWTLSVWCWPLLLLASRRS